MHSPLLCGTANHWNPSNNITQIVWLQTPISPAVLVWYFFNYVLFESFITLYMLIIFIFGLVWQKLEEENSEFFRAYYIRLKLKKQIILFNQLLEHQYHLMKFPAPPKVPLTPIQNEIHHMPGNFSF